MANQWFRLYAEFATDPRVQMLSKTMQRRLVTGVRGGRLECDHIVPVARGGQHTDDDSATACFRCDRRKHDKLVSDCRCY